MVSAVMWCCLRGVRDQCDMLCLKWMTWRGYGGDLRNWCKRWGGGICSGVKGCGGGGGGTITWAGEWAEHHSQIWARYSRQVIKD